MNFPRSGGTVLITTDGRSIDNPRCSEILVENRPVAKGRVSGVKPPPEKSA